MIYLINKYYANIKKIIRENIGFFIIWFVVILLFLVDTPYLIYTPGSYIDLNTRLDVDTDNKTSGTFGMAYVSVVKASPIFIGISYLNKNWDLVSKDKVKYDEANYTLQNIGEWKITSYLEKRTCDGYLISYGDFLNTALEIQEDLKTKNIYLQVINARYIKPMDIKILAMLAKQNKPVFVYEEIVSIGSLGSEIAKYLLEHNFNNIYENYTVPDEFIKQGKRAEIIKLLKLDKDSISKKIEKKMKNANRS